MSFDFILFDVKMCGIILLHVPFHRVSGPDPDPVVGFGVFCLDPDLYPVFRYLWIRIRFQYPDPVYGSGS